MTKKQQIIEFVASKTTKETFTIKEIAEHAGCTVARVHEVFIRDAKKPLIKKAEQRGQWKRTPKK